MTQPRVWDMPLFIDAYNGLALFGKSKEGRAPNPSDPNKDYRTMKVGDILRFYAIGMDKKVIKNLPEIRFGVNSLNHYNTAREMLEAEGIEALLPGVTSLEEGEQIYMDFPGYGDRIPKYGIYAMGLEKL